MARTTIEPNEDGVRMAPLGALGDFEVAEGYPDVRGWKVLSSDGREVGKVHDLLIDVDNMRTRYLDVRLTKELAAMPGDRDVLVPIGTAQVADGDNVVRVPLTAERVGLLPLYDHGRLSRVHELEVRRHFSLGEAAAAAATGAAVGSSQRAFYDDAGYDDRRFFGARRTAVTDAEAATARRDAERAVTDREVALRDAAARDTATRDTAARDAAARDVAARDAERERERADREIRAADGEVRVPIERDESVVLKRGEGGRDEIIIRRPIAERDQRAP